MRNARVISEAHVIPNRAAGYLLKDQVLNNQKWVAPSVNTTADGSLYFTVEDLAKWDDALEAQKLLKRPSYEQMWTPVRLNDRTTVPTVSVGEFQKPTRAVLCSSTAARGKDSRPTLYVIPTIDSPSLHFAIVRVQALDTLQNGSLDFTFRLLRRDHTAQSHLILRP